MRTHIQQYYKDQKGRLYTISAKYSFLEISQLFYGKYANCALEGDRVVCSLKENIPDDALPASKEFIRIR